MASQFLQKFLAVQDEFVLGKNKRNDFGKFDYRNVEDMLAVLKPILKKHGLLLIFRETITSVEGRVYVMSDAAIKDAETGEDYHTTAFAREPLDKKGMDDSQITGSTTSYARKSALAGLLAVDSGDRDPDEGDPTSPAPDAPDEETGLDPKKAELLAAIRKFDPLAPQKMLKIKKANSFQELPLEYFQSIHDAYQKKSAKKEGAQNNG